MVQNLYDTSISKRLSKLKTNYFKSGNFSNFQIKIFRDKELLHQPGPIKRLILFGKNFGNDFGAIQGRHHFYWTHLK